MSDINNTEAMRTWLRTCPAIIAERRFRIDYMEEDAEVYALYSVPSPLRYRENILGEMTLEDNQSQNFIFAAKEPYGADIQQNLQNLGFFEAVTRWIYDQNAVRNFPEWEDGEVRSIVATLTGYPVRAGADAAKYQIQLKVNYRRR